MHGGLELELGGSATSYADRETPESRSLTAERDMLARPA